MSKSTHHNVPEQRVQRFVQLNTRMWEATLKSEQEFLKQACNISAAQLQVILAVGQSPSCTMGHLAKILHFSQANVTQMANSLIAKKFLKRQRSKEDRRVVYLNLLEKGQRICKLHREHVERTAREWFAKMPDEDQEMMLQFWEKYLL